MCIRDRGHDRAARHRKPAGRLRPDGPTPVRDHDPRPRPARRPRRGPGRGPRRYAGAARRLRPHGVRLSRPGRRRPADGRRPPRIRPPGPRVPRQRPRGKLPGRTARHELLEPPPARGVPHPSRLRPARPPAGPLRPGDRPHGRDPRRLLRGPHRTHRRGPLQTAGRLARRTRHARRRRPEPPRPRGLPCPVHADLLRLLPHPPLVRRRRQRPPRGLQGPLLHGPPLRPRARLDRGVPLLRLGRHPGGHLRLAPAVPAQRSQPVQPARQLLRHRRRLVRVGATLHRLAPALLGAVPGVLPGRRPDLLDHVLGHLQRRRGGAAPHRHHAVPHPPGRTRPPLRRRPPGRGTRRRRRDPAPLPGPVRHRQLAGAADRRAGPAPRGVRRHRRRLGPARRGRRRVPAPRGPGVHHGPVALGERPGAGDGPQTDATPRRRRPGGGRGPPPGLGGRTGR